MADSEIKNLLSTLTANVNNNHTSLSEKIDRINERIDESNKSITAEIHNLETRVFNEIQRLDADQALQQRAINFNKKSMEGEIGQLQQDLEAQKNVIKERDDQIVRLERACHAGLQHNRGFNVEIDGIPSNVELHGDIPTHS